MMKKRTALVLILCSVLVAIVLTAGLTLNWAVSYMQNRQVVVADSDYEILDMIKGMFKSYGLEPPDDETLLMTAAHAMASQSGDVYAQYFTAEEYEAYVSEQNGNYVGVGITVQQDMDTNAIMVTHVIKNGPAAEAGLLPGDQVISVNGEDTYGWTVSELADCVRGEEGTEVTLGVLRTDNSTAEFTMVRKAVVEEFVTGHMVDSDIAYIRITQFAGDADNDFIDLTKSLVKQGAKGIVLDLRDNPGGDKTIVCHIADSLFPEGPIIIREDREGHRVTDYSDSTCLNIPLVVLANEYSASASELLIGGIQDYKVGTFVGTQTYGKGVVQTFLPMPDGSSVMKLTTDRYLTPNERSIHKVGCTPDIVLEPSEELLRNPVLMGTEQDNQMQKALELLKEKIK